ncbi:hypothetical protein J2X66_001968 [Pseudomonas sp. 3296]|uniref:hypothetical protein n=1 Tax=Pseudomonas sp. 3296 TaxID=2817753 RepID=UPI002865311B|nr:hypothetical protein [Pseudomonas sp. 3296]MDR6915103.1 hypothetical protein [Pseudomonas sp. 3296]
MDLKVIEVRAQGDETKEVVVMRALKDCNLKGYMIFDETFKSDGSTSNVHRHVFIFPGWKVEKDDYVFLSTRAGTNRKGATTEGSAAHYFHWNLNSPVWNEKGDKVHLINVENAITFKVPSVA